MDKTIKLCYINIFEGKDSKKYIRNMFLPDQLVALTDLKKYISDFS